MMRQLLLGIATAATLGAATLSLATPANAQSWSVQFGSGHSGGYQQVFGGHGRDHDRNGYGGGHRGGWDRGGWDRGGWDRGGHGGGWRGRPAYNQGYGHQPRCFVRKVRYWDGWGWVVDRRQVCN